MADLDKVRRKPAKVVLNDGIEREVKFTLNTLADLEEKYGTVDDAFKGLEKGNIAAIRFILWAALRNEDEQLTERQVGDLIDINSIGDIMKGIEAATRGDLPDKEETVVDATVVEGEVVPN